MISSKECFKCKTVKPLEDFYKHSMMADGRFNKCKTCTKSDVLEHRNKNLERIREYDRERGKKPERRASSAAISQAWRREDPRRQRAHNAVTRAIKKERLVRAPCCRCGSERSLAHHEDYDKPLDVIWLCQPCHKQRHKEMNLGK
jgi:hypothetical protein